MQTKIGALLMGLGSVAIILGFMGRSMRLLSFIDDLGTVGSWGVKIGLVVVGFLLYNYELPFNKDNEEQ